MNGSLHPGFRFEERLAMLAAVALLAAGVFFLGCGIVFVLLGAGFLNTLVSVEPVSWLTVALLDGLCFLTGLVLVSFGRHMLGTYRKWLRHASWLVRNTQSRSMIMTIEPAPGPGRRVLLSDFLAPGSAFLLDVRSSQWRLRDPRPTPADVYREPGPEGLVVVCTDKGALWGFPSETRSPIL